MGHAQHLAEEHPALGAEAGVGEFLVVVPAEPAGVEPAGETHLQLVAGGLGIKGGEECGARHLRHHLVEGRAVDARDAGDVLGGLQAAFDLEGGHAGAHEVGQHIEAREVLGTEQITAVAQWDLFAVGDEVVGQPAGLGALAAVGGTAAERFAGEALAGVGDAKCAMDEHLERQRHLGGGLGGIDLCNIREGVFPGQHHELGAEIAGERHAGGACDGHLRGAVDGKIR